MSSTLLRRKPPHSGFCRFTRVQGPLAAHRGFTLVELVVVMLVMAIVATVGMGRFAARESFAVQGVADQLVSALRLAQSTAVAQRATVYVALGSSPASLTVCADVGCTQPLSPPGASSTWLENAQGLELSAVTTFQFTASGAPSLGTAFETQVRTADGSVVSRAIRVEPVSGHVHQP
jgi:MSHA pilin protein MshC